MKYLKLIIVLTVILAGMIKAQEMVSGYYVDTPNMSEEVKRQLENKLKASMSKAGLQVADGFFPLFTAIKYDEQEVIAVEGIRRTYKAMGVVHIFLLFAESNQMLSSVSFDISGVGTSENLARTNAVKAIELNPVQFKTMLSKVKVNYKDAIEAYGNKKYKAASAFKGKTQYEDAINEASLIPETYSKNDMVEKLISECNAAIEKRIKDSIDFAQKQELARIDLEKTKFLEEEKTKRETEIARLDAEKTRIQEESRMEQLRKAEDAKTQRTMIREEHKTQRTRITERGRVDALYASYLIGVK